MLSYLFGINIKKNLSKIAHFMQFPIYPFRGVRSCSKRRLIEVFGEKIAAPKFFQ